MTAYEIRTPFLRYLLLYYGNLAVQLRPVRLSNPISLLNFLWNFSLTILCFSIAISQIGRFEEEMFEQILEPKAGDFFQQPGQLLSEARTYPNELANRKKLNKPLFDILTKLVLRFAFPTAYGTCLLYFFALSLFSRSNLVELFDSFEVDSFRSRLWSARMTLRIIIATHVNFITVVPSFFWADVRRADWLNPIEVLRLGYTYFTFYVLKFCILLIIGVVFYFRFALYSSLRKIRTDFEVEVSTKNPNSDQGLKCLELRIRKLAFISWQINQLLSVPLLLITFVYTFDVIIEIASLLLDNNRMDIFYQIALSSNLLIIVYYNEAINWELKVMSCKLQENYLQKLETPKSDHDLLFYKTKSSHFSEEDIHKALKSKEIIDIYREYFQLRLYNFCTFNMSFTFSTTLFIINYSVLVTQTNG